MIQSFLIRNAEGGVQYLLYDTVVDGKHVYTACGIGRVENGDARLTPIATQTFNALAGHIEHSHGALGTVRFQEIARLRGVTGRVAKGLEAAEHGELVFFVCRDHQIYDAAVVALNVQHVIPGAQH